jgi:glycosyltransferase involved in cell wall biosynthesis
MRGARSKVVVVAWDLAHNGASTAFMLADLLRREHEVEIAGPTFLGSELWAPIRHADIPIRSFPGTPLPQFLEDAERFVADVEADVIYACKPRFPTLLLASLIKDQCEAPVILHVDDLELGLVGATAASSLAELEAIRHHDPAAFTNPAGRAWTSACEELIAGADAITASGEPLRRRYGGSVIGQPRDETQFDPALVDRGSVRASLGYGDEDRVVLFLGSPRRHKGIAELAAAVAELDHPRVKLCVIGAFTDARLRAEIAAAAPDRIQLIDSRPVSEVPGLTAIGDLVCLPQDAAVEFVADQTPMKLTEALAMEVPVLARETPALAPFIRAGVIAPIGDAPLSGRVGELLEEPERVREMVRRGREHFLTHLSYAAALTSLGRVLADLPVAPLPMPDSWERACELASSCVEHPGGRC